MNKFSVNNLAVKFQDKEVLKQISFELKPGNIYGLLGLNGAGKTTIIRSIFNEITQYDGEIKIDGKTITQHDYAKMYYFAENNSLPKTLTIYEYLKLESTLRSIPRDHFKTKIAEFEKTMPNINFKKKKIKSLSSGQQKLVSLLCTMLIDCELIFFDEPTANLDFENKKFVLDYIKKQQNQNKIIVMVTHLVDEVQTILNNVLILDEGVIKRATAVKPGDNVKEIFEKNVTFKNEEFGSLGL
jgi:ABC-2 type transport system ATP-binding protein